MAVVAAWSLRMSASIGWARVRCAARSMNRQAGTASSPTASAERCAARAAAAVAEQPPPLRMAAASDCACQAALNTLTRVETTCVAWHWQGHAGTSPRSAFEEKVEAEACDRLYLQGQEQRRRQKHREQAGESGKSGGDGGGGDGGSAVTASLIPSALVGVGGAGTRSEVRGTLMHFEAKILQQKRDQLLVDAQRHLENAASLDAHRTVTLSGGPAASERLYRAGLERRAKQEREIVEQQQRAMEAEIEGVTFMPSVCGHEVNTPAHACLLPMPRFCCCCCVQAMWCDRCVQIDPHSLELQTDSRPVEQRMHDWWESTKAKHADAAATSHAASLMSPVAAQPLLRGHGAGAGGTGGSASSGRSTTQRIRPDPAYQGGRVITVDSLSEHSACPSQAPSAPPARAEVWI